MEGHPAFIVHASGRGWLDPQPDIVLSGVNYGANVGRAVLHSGTVGRRAHREPARLAGAGRLARLRVGDPRAAALGRRAHVLPAGAGPAAGRGARASCSRVNVPDRPAAELGALREAKLSSFGMVTITVRHHDEVDASVLRATAADLQSEPEPETDVALLAAGHPTVTRLTSVAALPGVLHVAGV